VTDHAHTDGHRVFSTDCFNRTWDLLDRAELTADETARMIDTAHASRYHWRMRDDVQPSHLAIGAWQLSRVYAAAGIPDAAVRYGLESLDLCRNGDLSAFLTGYAFEALGRAATLGGDPETAARYLAEARNVAANVENEHDQAMLLGDIEDAARG